MVFRLNFVLFFGLFLALLPKRCNDYAHCPAAPFTLPSVAFTEVHHSSAVSICLDTTLGLGSGIMRRPEGVDHFKQ